MKKYFIFTFITSLVFSAQTFAFYPNYEIDSFIYSPNKDELSSVEGDTNNYCERIYLEASRRREFTKEELEICRDIFSIKREQEIEYKRYVLGQRGIY